MPYVLGIDIGGTTTTAAVCRWAAGGWGPPEVVPLGGRSRYVPSVLHLGTDGSLTVDTPALPEPDRLARGFIHRVGDEVPLVLGGELCPPEALAAVLAMWVAERVLAREGEAAEYVVLSHPGSWGRHRRSLLHRALRDIGLHEVSLLPAPVVAAESHASAGWEGSTLAVYTMGGSDHAGAVVRRRERAGFQLLSNAGSVEPFGGADIDAALAAHVQASLGGQLRDLRRAGPAAQPAWQGLRRECVRAKERLTTATEAALSVPLPGGAVTVPVTQAQLSELIRPALQVAVSALAEALRGARLGPRQLDGVLLAGGAVRTPLVAELVASEYPDCSVVVADEPRYCAAAGAAVAAGKIVSPPAGRPEPSPPYSPAPQQPGAAAGATRDAPVMGNGGRNAGARRGGPPPRPPVEIAPLELPGSRGRPRRAGLVGGRS